MGDRPPEADDSISVLHPFQQIILFLLFIVGDFGFVSWIMVLIRKRFFRKHCEELLRRNNALRRSRTRLVLDRAKTLKGRYGSRKPYAGETISGPVNARPVDDYISERMTDSPIDVRGSHPDTTNVGEGQGGGGIDAATQSASTTAQSSAVLKGVGGTGDSGSSIVRSSGTTPDEYNSLRRERTVQIVTPATPTTFHARQRIRAESRTISLSRTVSGPDLQRSNTFARQVGNRSATPRQIPTPKERKHVGMGGFPIPIHLFSRIIPQSAQSHLHSRLTRSETRHTLLLSRTDTVATLGVEASGRSDNWDELRATVASWMPEKLGGLVVGRNSRFFSEELDDEELEQLGGVEYRALRLLSYLVPAVGPFRDPGIHADLSSISYFSN